MENMGNKNLQKMLGVNWENSNVLELGQRLVTIISRGRALQKSDAYIMRDIMNHLATEGYGKMVDIKNWKDVDTRSRYSNQVFEPIKIEEVQK